MIGFRRQVTRNPLILRASWLTRRGGMVSALGKYGRVNQAAQGNPKEDHAC